MVMSALLLAISEQPEFIQIVKMSIQKIKAKKEALALRQPYLRRE